MVYVEHKKEVINKDPEDIKLIGIVRGIKSIAVLSNNKVFKILHLREFKVRIETFASPSDSVTVK